MRGFKISETMSGTHAFVGDYENCKINLPLYFKIDWSYKNTLECLKRLVTMKPVTFEVKGRFFAEGLCDEIDCVGGMHLDYFGNHTISYCLEMRNPSYSRVSSFEKINEHYFFIGDKINIKPWNLLTSHTTCYGIITNGKGELISKCKVFFKLRTLPAMLASFSWV